MNKIVITGGAGFIGSHIVEHFVNAYPNAEIIVLDKMTYAADVRNLMHLISVNKIRLVVGDICHLDTCLSAVKGADLVIHAAAESHVDNSFGNSLEFTRTNVTGTHCLMEACRSENVAKIIHVSTDEVYGEVLEGSATEDTTLKPTNPYSASKAAAEMIISGYLQSYKMPIVMVRANNIFGKRQFPEKIIPKFALNLILGKPLTIHGNGKNCRHYLSADDFAVALELLAKKGVIGECYNIGTTEEYTNMQMAYMLCDIFDVDPDKTITFIKDRPFNDQRYAVDWSKITALGWTSQHSLINEISDVAQWYYDNADRYVPSADLKTLNAPTKLGKPSLELSLAKVA
ncbi:MAG: dTDP-glucose 4,6-dehydratase [Alphaproteobacteria bacterium]|nr:MAG: dTDP-glucose 4,6-dehydratase [Alphaproteobacteria bacterium]